MNSNKIYESLAEPSVLTDSSGKRDLIYTKFFITVWGLFCNKGLMRYYNGQIFDKGTTC